MSGLNKPIWVDPEGVMAVARSYAGHIAMYDSYLQQVDHLRLRYADAWGDDDLGHQFKKQFDLTMDVVEGIILGVKGTLEYASVGLRTSGEGYRQADDDANEAGRYIGAEFAALPTQVAFREPAEEPAEHEEERLFLRSTPPAEGVVAPTRMNAGRLPGEPGLEAPRLAGRARRIDATAEDESFPPSARLTARGPADLGIPPISEHFSSQQTPLLPIAPGIPANGIPFEQTPEQLGVPGIPADGVAFESQVRAAAIPAAPLISSHVSHPTDGVLIDGAPIPEGYQLQTLNSFDDGTSRLDVNYYESVIPVGGRPTVTGSDGQPVDRGAGHLFLMKPYADLNFDPTSPDYRPMLISFASDGTPRPL